MGVINDDYDGITAPDYSWYAGAFTLDLRMLPAKSFPITIEAATYY